MTIIVFVFYPETKGRSLEEMDIVFQGSVLAFRNKNIPMTQPIGNVEKGSVAAVSVDAKE